MPRDMSSELAYWERELSLQGDYPDAILNRSQPERMDREFPFYLMPLFEELRRHRPVPLVLDVGSGPLSMLAYGHYHGLINLICADPLASSYFAILDRYRLRPSYPIVNIKGERLTDVFGPDSFDMVWMHNALDHTEDPGAVMRELVAVLRPGGYLVIQGWVREGTAEGWNGLHQHDLYIAEGNRLMCESRVGESVTEPVCISDGLPLTVLESTPPEQTPRTWMRIIWRKR